MLFSKEMVNKERIEYAKRLIIKNYGTRCWCSCKEEGEKETAEEKLRFLKYNVLEECFRIHESKSNEIAQLLVLLEGEYSTMKIGRFEGKSTILSSSSEENRLQKHGDWFYPEHLSTDSIDNLAKLFTILSELNQKRK